MNVKSSVCSYCEEYQMLELQGTGSQSLSTIVTCVRGHTHMHTHTCRVHLYETNALPGPLESFCKPHKATKSTMLSFMLELYRGTLPPQLLISLVEIAQKTVKLSTATPRPLLTYTHTPRSKFSAISKKTIQGGEFPLKSLETRFLQLPTLCPSGLCWSLLRPALTHRLQYQCSRQCEVLD